jgi:hypothetical protein
MRFTSELPNFSLIIAISQLKCRVLGQTYNVGPEHATVKWHGKGGEKPHSWKGFLLADQIAYLLADQIHVVEDRPRSVRATNSSS